MNTTKYYFLLFLVINLINGFAQENGKPFITNYTSKQYRGHTQNWVIEKDTNGIMYFGNQAGVLTFDGINWRTIPISNHSTVRSMGQSDQGEIYVGAVGEFGVLKANNQGKVEFVSLKPLLDSSLQNFADVWNIAAFKSKVYFLTDNYIFIYDGNEINYFKPRGAYFYSCFSTPDQLFVQDFEYGFTVLKNDSLVLIPNGREIRIESIHAIMPVDEDNIVIATREKGLIAVNIKKGSFDLRNIDLRWYAKEKQLYHAVQLSENTFAIATIQNGILIVDEQGKFIEVINKSSGLLDETVYFLYKSGGVLWCALEKGIAKIEYGKTFRYWDETVGLQGSITDVQRFNNKLFVASGGGLFTLEKDNTVELDKFKREEAILSQTWDLQLFNNDLLIATGRGLQAYSGGNFEDILRGKSIYKILISKFKHNRIYVGQLNQVSYVDYNEHEKKFSTPVVIKKYNSEVRDLIEDKEGNLWAALNYIGVAKIKLHETSDSNYYSSRVFSAEKGLPVKRELRFYMINQQLVFASDLGTYAYDSKSEMFIESNILSDYLGLDVSETLIYSGAKNKHWINGKYICNLNNEIKHIDSTTLKRLPSFNVELLHSESDEITWIGTSNGIFKIDAAAKRAVDTPFKTLIRKVITKNDSVLYWGSNYLQRAVKIDQHTNFISFHYVSPYFAKNEELLYSYILDGYDSEWSDWSEESKKDFTNLYEGKYTFKVKAKNYLGEISAPDEFSFVVLPPIYRSFLAYLLYGLLLMGVISFSVYVRTRKLKLDKIKLERVIHARTQEIVHQKNQIENTARKLTEANKELEKLSIIVRKSDNAVVVFDKNGRVEWINEGFTQMYGYTIEQFINEKGADIFEVSQMSDIHATIKKCFDTKETVIYQYLASTRSEKNIWIQTTLTPLLDSSNNIEKLVAIDTDISKIKHAEQEIENQRDELKKANDNKDKLFSIIAHDLRGPLSNIFTLLNIVHQDIDTFSHAELDEIIGQLKETTGNTFNLTENLLDWAHLRRDSINYLPKAINIYELIQENIELFSSQALKKDILLQNLLRGKELAYADEEMIKTVVRNLLGNAIKFTDKNGQITFTAYNDNHMLYVSIKDTGKGMEQWEVDKLFKIDQPHTTLGTHKEKGSGLGLILSKEFVEKNGGEIYIESKKGQGSIFSFSLPIK